jgi:hypothetical protein
MRTKGAFLTVICFLAACSHQSLPSEGGGGTGGSAGGGGSGTGTGGADVAGASGTGGTGGGSSTGGNGGCATPNPAEACRTSPDQCLSSSCKCGAGNWVCTRDCGGGRTCTGADGGANCPPTCFRAVRCVTSCGGPTVTFGCCSCVPPAFDDISCPKSGAFERFLYNAGGGLCPPNSDCSTSTELLASGLLRHDCMGQIPVVVHEAMVSPGDRDAVIAVVTDPALVALLDQPNPPCQPPTDVSESMALFFGGKTHKNSVTLCQQQPIVTARNALAKLVARYLAGKCPMR